MYRTIFIFDIGDLLPPLTEAAHRLYQRKPELRARYPLQRLISAWFYNHLWEDLHLALLPSPDEDVIREVDAEFLDGDDYISRRLYDHISMAIYPNHNPYYESWCRMTVGYHDLMLTYDMGPIDYSPVPAKDKPACS